MAKGTNEPAGALPDPQTLTYEQAVAELEAIIERIEQGKVGLEQSLAEHRRGAALLKRCRTIIEAAEQQVEKEGPGVGGQGSGKTVEAD